MKGKQYKASHICTIETSWLLHLYFATEDELVIECRMFGVDDLLIVDLIDVTSRRCPKWLPKYPRYLI